MRNSSPKQALGLVHLYIGNGKGKTTAAAGLALRANGTGLRVLFVQFLKGRPSGEIGELERLGIEVRRVQSSEKFVFSMDEKERKAETARNREAMDTILEDVRGDRYDLMVLDEILDACSLSLVPYDSLYALIEQTRQMHCELVLTGRGVPLKLYELADYISEITPLKHPFTKGISARKGIEF